MRAVVDTNVFFSALRVVPVPGRLSPPGQLLLRAGWGDFTLIMSEAILAELEGVLERKFQWEQSRLAATMARIRDMSEIVHPSLTVADCRDPDDNRILEAAIEGRADLIVSGDKDLLDMKAFRGIEI
jgi:putative PIN family toxin of toxin-antitoxin system